MNLEQFMTQRGYYPGHGNKCLCPFHSDNTPSCYLNPNNIYCFTCVRTYTLYDFRRVFGVHLERVDEGSEMLNSIKGTPTGLSPNEVIFTYNWSKPCPE